MTLKINYLDTPKGSFKNTALFLSNDTKISEFKGIFDDKINQKIVNYLKKSKNNKKNKIESINIDFDQRVALVFLSGKNNAQVSEELGAKFYDYIKVGLPLALILGVMAVIFIPIIWPFQ